MRVQGNSLWESACRLDACDSAQRETEAPLDIVLGIKIKAKKLAYPDDPSFSLAWKSKASSKECHSANGHDENVLERLLPVIPSLVEESILNEN